MMSRHRGSIPLRSTNFAVYTAWWRVKYPSRSGALSGLIWLNPIDNIEISDRIHLMSNSLSKTLSASQHRQIAEAIDECLALGATVAQLKPLLDILYPDENKLVSFEKSEYEFHD